VTTIALQMNIHLMPPAIRARSAVALTRATLLLLSSWVHAARTSASYSIPADSIDIGGAQVQSASYSVKGSAAGEFGAGLNALLTSATYTGKGGYVGELYDIVGLAITSPPSTSLNENTSRQLSAAPLADDSTTTTALSPSAVSWSIVSGAISSISTSGLATAATVYQDTPSIVSGSAQGLTGQLNLTILNVNTDDFGAYAGDGIDDSWQVQYFGQPPNALAGPNVDADGTGQTNLFKFVAGLNPLDGSRFTLSIQKVSGQPAQRNVIFQPLVSGRTYNVQFKTSLTTPSWQALTGTTQSDNGTTRTVTDTSAAAPKYYHVQISKP
jgi:hypothetical protein